VPRYREVNPGFFTIVTFPYLFGFMFGDIGHGLALLLLGLFLVKNNDTLGYGSLRAVFRLRYLFSLMGFFALFCGLIYNDFFSIPWNLFGSCYKREHHSFVQKYEGCVYPIGFDPLIYQSQTEVAFLNSFKMKLSIIAGVIHMVLGICMKGLNSLHFKNYVDFFFEFLP